MPLILKRENGLKKELEELTIILSRTKEQKQQNDFKYNEEITRNIQKIGELETIIEKYKKDLKE